MISAEFVGTREAADFLDRLGGNAPRAIHNATGTIVREIFDESQQRVNVDTGRLKASGQIIEGSNEWRIVYSAYYARFVHDGTWKMTGSFYLSIPLQNHLSGMRTRIAHEVGRELGF